MNDNGTMFPNISEKVDLKKASLITGLGYHTLYKIIVLQGEIGYYKYNKKIIVDVSDLFNLMQRHFIEQKGFDYDSKKKSN